MNNELYHYVVLGMKWGHHTATQAVGKYHSWRANVNDKKLTKIAPKLQKTLIKKPFNPVYDIRAAKYMSLKNKYENHKNLADTYKIVLANHGNDPVDKFFKKMDKSVDKGLNWCVDNTDTMQKVVDKLNNVSDRIDSATDKMKNNSNDTKKEIVGR